MATAVLVAFIVVAATNGNTPSSDASRAPGSPMTSSFTSPPTASVPPTTVSGLDPPSMGAPSGDSGTSPTSPTPSPWHPGSVFDGKFLVAYYGTAGTGSLGVLGSQSIPNVTTRLRAAAAPFAAASGEKVQIVYELIATMADSRPEEGDTYSHDIPRADVQAYLRAAHRNHALLVLDLQPGRSDFLTVAKRYAWALQSRPTSGSRSTRSGGCTATRCPARSSGRSPRPRSTRRPATWLRHRTTQPAAPEAVPDPPVRARLGDRTSPRSSRCGAWRWCSTSTAGVFGPTSSRPTTPLPGRSQFTIGFKLFYRDDWTCSRRLHC